MLPFNRLNDISQLGSGKLITFKYLFYKNDPSPLLLITRIYPDNNVAGINLHYLTQPYIKHMIRTYCGNNMFSYPLIKDDNFIMYSFRTYKKAGIKNVNILDCEIIKPLLNVIKSYNPDELKIMQEQIRKQMNQLQSKDSSALNNPKETPIVDNKLNGWRPTIA